MIVRVHAASSHNFLISAKDADEMEKEHGSFDETIAEHEGLALAYILYDNLPGSTVGELMEYLQKLSDEGRDGDTSVYHKRGKKAAKECEI